MKKILLKNKIKGVIFDFDDTIVNSRIGKETALKFISKKISHYLKNKKINIKPDKIFQTIIEMEKIFVSKGICNRNIWWESFFKKINLKKIPKNFLNNLTKKYWEITTIKSKLYKDTVSILTYLKKRGYLLGLLTDTDGVKKVKLKRIKLSGIGKRFDSIVIAGEDLKKVKPDPEPFLLITKKLKLKPKQCVYIGNHPIIDVFGAKRIGMKTILINREKHKLTKKPDFIIKELSELKKIFV